MVCLFAYDVDAADPFWVNTNPSFTGKNNRNLNETNTLARSSSSGLCICPIDAPREDRAGDARTRESRELPFMEGVVQATRHYASLQFLDLLPRKNTKGLRSLKV